MGSWFKNDVVTTCLLAMTMAMPGVALSDAEGSAHPTAPVIDTYYRAYPPVKVINPEQGEQVKRGEYLAKMGDCIACHSNVKAGTPAFAGGLPIATPFGTFYSPNITPDEKTGIGQWTEEDFIRALKQGRDPKGRNYFPVFPYVYFANISDDDAKAMYAYFMSIPAVEQENKPLPFPFNLPGIRSTLLGWNLLFFYPNSQIQYDPQQSPIWNRGKYIVDGLGHCSMCHTPLNALGAPKMQYYLSGGFIDGYWAPNIGKFALEAATPHEIGNVFANNQLLYHAGPVAGPMAEVNYDSLRYLTEEDRDSIGVYLKTVVSEDLHGLKGSDNPPSLRRGKQVYMKACVICHQDGRMNAPRLGDGPNLYKRLKYSGLNGFYRHVLNGYNSMPIKGACVTCSDNDIISSVDYLLDASLSRSQRLDLAHDAVKKFPSSGREIYQENCSVCHSDPKSGAPQIGDKVIWKPIIQKNIDVLVEEMVKGEHHPVNGGCKHCNTAELIEAIKYIVSLSKTEGNYTLW